MCPEKRKEERLHNEFNEGLIDPNGK